MLAGGMGLLDGWRRWRTAQTAGALLARGAADAARALVGSDPVLRQRLAESLLERGDLEASRALLGHEGPSTLAALLDAPAADPELDRLLAEAAAPRLPDDERVLALAGTLTARGHDAEALSLLERAALQRQHWPLLREALERCCEAEAWARAWPLVEGAFSALALTQGRGTPDHEFVLRAHELVLRNLESAEAVTVDLLMRGELDPFSGDNHLLLAKALMRGGPLASRLHLVPAAQELKEGEARLARDRTDATGLMQVGSARLRLGELPEALAAFERGRDVAPKHFGLVAGLGAARRLGESRDLDRVARLPALTPPPGLAAVLPDLDALTALERRVVLASVEPLARWLPALAEAGAQLRVLPLDVRVTDLPDFEALRGRLEARDRRAWDALGGLAGDGLACVRVEALFDLGELAWALAHELAHLVHAVLPEAAAQRIHEGWVQACAAEYAFDQYQLHDEHEFFAVTYTRWLARRYGLPLEQETDADGHLARALACVDAVREG